MKKLSFILSVIFIVFALSSCKLGEPRPYSRGNELIFWHSMGGPMEKILNDMVDQYNSQNPEYNIKAINRGSYSALIQSLLAGIPAKRLPDITQAYESWTSKFIDNDVIVSLQDYFDQLSEEDRNDFYEVLINNNSFDGTLWSIPFNKSVPVLYYNKDMFERHGISPPRRWSPDGESEFDEICKALTIDDDNDGIPNQWGYAFNISVWIWECLLFQAGGRITDDDEKEALFNSEAGIEAIKWWKSLVDRKYAFTRQGFEFQNNFASGNVGMIMATSVSKNFLKHKLTFNLGITHLPYHKRRAVVLSGTNLVIIRSDPEREKAAWDFLQWLTSPEITAHWAVQTNYLPVRRSALNTEIMKRAIEDDPSVLVPLQQIEYAFYEPQSSAWYNSRNILSETLEMIMLGIWEPQTALDNAVKKVNAELNK